MTLKEAQAIVGNLYADTSSREYTLAEQIISIQNTQQKLQTKPEDEQA